MALPPHAHAWLRQRQLGAIAVATVEEAELRALDEVAARAQSEALLDALPATEMPEERRTWSGFVEQQRIFARARR